VLDWFRTRHSDVLADIRTSEKIADEDAFDALVVAFAEQFEGSTQAADKAPDAESTGTESNIVDATTTLPEEDISETE
jgi:predicted RNase H-like nuclease